MNPYITSVIRIDIMGVAKTPMRALYIPANKQSPNHPRKPTDTEDLIEFYDSRYDHTPDGQFISAFYTLTLKNIKDKVKGLPLCGDVPEWHIDGDTICIVLNWIRYHVYELGGVI